MNGIVRKAGKEGYFYPEMSLWYPLSMAFQLGMRFYRLGKFHLYRIDIVQEKCRYWFRN